MEEPRERAGQGDSGGERRRGRVRPPVQETLIVRQGELGGRLVPDLVGEVVQVPPVGAPGRLGLALPRKVPDEIIDRLPERLDTPQSLRCTLKRKVEFGEREGAQSVSSPEMASPRAPRASRNARLTSMPACSQYQGSPPLATDATSRMAISASRSLSRSASNRLARASQNSASCCLASATALSKSLM